MTITGTIAIIGGGNVGGAIAAGMLKQQVVQPENLRITRRRSALLEDFRKQGAYTGSDNIAAVQDADMVIMALKPYHIEDVSRQLEGRLKPGAIVIFVAAGVTIDQVRPYFSNGNPVYSAMPNTATAIGQGMTCIAVPEDDIPQTGEVMQVFEQLGQALIIPEDLMPAATVIGACGVAFALRFIRATMQGGIEIGFSADVAQKITAQTVKGAAELIQTKGLHPEQEIDKVTTPKGITISGINTMEHSGFSSALIKGLVSSYEKVPKK